ncbi:hypothetical protein DAEQUDRAFT_79458 [Daedalea quercina L-15889]|uniref:Uncharacterized protein n=1 Tax=Daedalea quercina L-15889 TaxID=1314783 RepID=A0A165SGM8_9APHY|nr:hypothetical protein DAEQUDRAFT_79458 [Daedalea quercina L-15889]
MRSQFRYLPFGIRTFGSSRMTSVLIWLTGAPSGHPARDKCGEVNSNAGYPYGYRSEAKIGAGFAGIIRSVFSRLTAPRRKLGDGHVFVATVLGLWFYG